MNSHPLKPSLQGDFDNLCGIYCLVNAIAYLYDGRLRRPALKNALLSAYSRWWDLEELLMDGMDEDVMDYLIDSVLLQGYYHERYPVQVHKPFIKTPRFGARRMLQEMESFFSGRTYPGTRLIIVGTLAHWYLAKHMDRSYIYFFDCAGYSKAHRRSFSRQMGKARYQLFPECIYFVERTMEV